MTDVVVVGGGFTGLSAALALSKNGVRVQLFEKEPEPGGLAGSFLAGNQYLEKFYHHWFTSDHYVYDLVRMLGSEDDIISRPGRTGMYYGNRFFKLAGPLDLLRFTPLSFIGRLRLGMLTLAARRVTDWRKLEDVTARDWLIGICGEEAYKVVWEPLLNGKFGEFANEVSAVWFWNKLKLRGGSRGKGGREMLMYYRGGFATLAGQIVDRIRKNGSEIHTSVSVDSLIVADGRIVGVSTSRGSVECQRAVLTTPLPVAAELLREHVSSAYHDSLLRIRYLSNICIVLELDRSLSSLYWVNVNDPSFPFVAVIEHTNFEPSETYGGRHIVYLSKYLPPSSPLFLMADADAVRFGTAALRRMFPDITSSNILGAHVWRANYSQPIVEKRYSSLIPSVHTELDGVFLSTMAQIYPEDRGTNYAIRSGFQVAQAVSVDLASAVSSSSSPSEPESQ